MGHFSQDLFQVCQGNVHGFGIHFQMKREMLESSLSEVLFIRSEWRHAGGIAKKNLFAKSINNGANIKKYYTHLARKALKIHPIMHKEYHSL